MGLNFLIPKVEPHFAAGQIFLLTNFQNFDCYFKKTSKIDEHSLNVAYYLLGTLSAI